MLTFRINIANSFCSIFFITMQNVLCSS